MCNIYIERISHMNSNDLFYIDGYYLDKYQIDCIKESNNLLVIAGAGCGKTSTILGKIKYLINKDIKEDEILCLSLTNDATNGLKNKINKLGYNVETITFHKLGLKILNNFYDKVNIANDNLLSYVVNEYFLSIVKYSYRKYLLMLEFKNYKYNEIINSKDFILFKESIVTFINLLKNKGLGIEFIYDLYNKSIVKHNYLFIMEIYKIYERELESTNSFDFNDMIFTSSNLVLHNKIKLNYKYIIIDEFQDTSMIRLNLIKNIIKFNKAKIMCVGDDYQSIYRFAGSDIELFLDFEKNFKDSKIMYLKNTYRNSKELLSVSCDFIMKNKYQIKKDLLSDKTNNKPIKIHFYKNRINALKYVLNLIKTDYMIIGRNNNDINYYVDKDTFINNYFTVHKSKGLESDNIILINLTDDTLGLPSKVRNNKFVSKLFNKELYKYDEERRLFYVAITRTKNNVYMLVDKNNMSIFIREIILNYKEYIEYI